MTFVLIVHNNFYTIDFHKKAVAYYLKIRT